MIANTINTFLGLTVQCAQCHNHKFDPIAQEDYYRLQAVFAAIDRADRPFYEDPSVAQKARELLASREQAEAERLRLRAAVDKAAGSALADLDRRIAEAGKPAAERPEYGYHSGLANEADAPRWVQVDLGRTADVDRVTLWGCRDDFNGIGAGFGFPVRYKVEVSDDPAFRPQDDDDRRPRQGRRAQPRHGPPDVRHARRARAVRPSHRDPARRAAERLQLRARRAGGLRRRGLEPRRRGEGLGPRFDRGSAAMAREQPRRRLRRRARAGRRSRQAHAPNATICCRRPSTPPSGGAVRRRGCAAAHRGRPGQAAASGASSTPGRSTTADRPRSAAPAPTAASPGRFTSSSGATCEPPARRSARPR